MIPDVSSSADVCRALRELNRRLGDQSTAMYMLERARGCRDRSKKFRNLWLEARPKVECNTWQRGKSAHTKADNRNQHRGRGGGEERGREGVSGRDCACIVVEVVENVRQEEVVWATKEVWEAVEEVMDRCLRNWISRQISNRRT